MRAAAMRLRLKSVSVLLCLCVCVRMAQTHGGSISDRSFSVLCFSTSSSSVLSLIRSSRLELYCSNILSMESMMLVFLPLLINLNWVNKEVRRHLDTGQEQKQRKSDE